MKLSDWVDVFDLIVSIVEIIVMGTLTYQVVKLNRRTVNWEESDRQAKDEEQKQIRRDKRINLVERLKRFYLEESPGYGFVINDLNAFAEEIAYREEDLVSFLNQEEREAIYKIQRRLEAHLSNPGGKEEKRAAAIDLANMVTKAVELIENNTLMDS